MPEQDEGACEVDEGEVVFDVSLPAYEESALIAQPGEESLDFPAALVAA